MLKSIEMWDFESHEHTLVDDLSEGLNLICGESNAGKTSIVRALRLVAYNEFDPKALRVGAKKCKVKVVSDKGSVQVTRGPKDNLWEITENGKPTVELDKVGVKAVPEACKILGLGIVHLGDTDVPVNIMEQLESHFMLSGIGDEKATGSVRAQIVDEISGLSGIEGVIKSVSLDNTRHGREVKRLEKDIDKTRSQLHDQDVLDKEASVLEEAEKHLQEREELLEAQSAAEAVAGEFDSVTERIKKLEAELSAMPNVEKATESLELAEDGMDVVSVGISLVQEFESVGRAKKGLSVELAQIGDVKKAQACIVSADTSTGRLRNMERLWADSQRTKDALNTLKSNMKTLPDESKAQTSMDKCLKLMERIEAMRKALNSKIISDDHEKSLREQIQDNEEALADAFKRRDEILKSVTICPINLGPVSPECLKGVRTPVIKESK